MGSSAFPSSKPSACPRALCASVKGASTTSKSGTPLLPKGGAAGKGSWEAGVYQACCLQFVPWECYSERSAEDPTCLLFPSNKNTISSKSHFLKVMLV